MEASQVATVPVAFIEDRSTTGHFFPNLMIRP
jgi:hypothetical protein